MKRFSGKHTSSLSSSSASAKYGSISCRNEVETTNIASPTTSTTTDKGATIASSVINLTNTIIGAGMLGLPGAFGGTGYVSGMILIALSAACAAHGLVLLTKVATLAGRPCSFYSVARAAVPRYTVLIDAAVAFNCFGTAVGM
jgi:amino acid permease